MNKIKKGLSGALAALVLAVSAFTAAPVKAEGTEGVELPKVNLLYGDHSPIMVGEKQNFYVTADFEGQVQYKLWLKDSEGEWHETPYTEAVDAKIPTAIPAEWTYAAGYNAAVVWVKTADTEGTKQKENKLSGGMVGYDDYQVRKFYTEKERPVVVGDSQIVKEINGLTVTVNGIEGMDETNQYRVTAYDYQTNQWIGIDNEFAAAPVEYTLPAAGYYLLDVQTKREGQENWEALKLEVINVEEAPVDEIPSYTFTKDFIAFAFKTDVNVKLDTETPENYIVTVNGQEPAEDGIWVNQDGETIFTVTLKGELKDEDIKIEVTAKEQPQEPEKADVEYAITTDFIGFAFKTEVNVELKVEDPENYTVAINGQETEMWTDKEGKTFFTAEIKGELAEEDITVEVTK